MFSIFYTAFIILGVFLDQMNKFIAQNNLDFTIAKVIIPKILSFQLVHNYGAAYGILQNQRIFLLMVSFFVLVLCYCFRKKLATTNYSKLALSFLFIGTIGNFLDRLMLGYVIDFVDIKVFPLFNVADVCIDISIILFLLELIIYKNEIKEN